MAGSGGHTSEKIPFVCFDNVESIANSLDNMKNTRLAIDYNS